jgi:hypothetical protein
LASRLHLTSHEVVAYQRVPVKHARICMLGQKASQSARRHAHPADSIESGSDNELNELELE